MSVEVHGRDATREAYRITTPDGRAWVPELLMASWRPGDRPSHQEAYEWISTNRARLITAVRDLTQGRTPKRPLDLMSLIDARDPAPSSLSKYSGEREGLAPRPVTRP